MEKFRWTVKKANRIIENGEEKPLGPIWFDDLKCWIGQHGINIKQMHHQYTLEQLENSRSFQQGLEMGWIETIDKYIPNESGPLDLTEIKQQMASLVGLVQQMAAQPQQVTPSIDPTILKEILEKVAGGINQNASGKTKDRVAEEAALKVREKMNANKVSNFESLGEKKQVNVDIDKLADALDNLPLDDE